MSGRPTREQADAAAEFLKSLSNPNRLMIVSRLAEGEASVSALEAGLGIRQPTLSQQLAGLREAGLVETRRDAKQVFYRLTEKHAARIGGVLSQLYGTPSAPQPRDWPRAAIEASEPGRAASRFARILPFPDAGGRA